ncbi:MAG: hypothetical protein GX891_04315 [Clostridiales bacterium]|nr:hypothetical protein [Clostridiales bacterium]
MKKKALLIIISLLLVAAFVMPLSACNKDKPFDYLSVYKNYPETGQYTGATKVAMLPSGYKLYLADDTYYHDYSMYGYNSELNAFVIMKGNTGTNGFGVIDLLKIGESTPLFSEYKNFFIIQMQYYYGYLFLMTSDQKILVYDTVNNGWVFSYENPIYTLDGTASLGKSITNFVLPISRDYAVTTVNNAAKDYLEKEFNLSNPRGDLLPVWSFKNREIVGRVKSSDSSLANIEGFENYIVATGFNDGAKKYAHIIDLSGYIAKSAKEITPKANGFVTADGSSSDDEIEITYFGDGKFLIHIESPGTESEYFYKDEAKTYWKVTRYLYFAGRDEKVEYRSDFVMRDIVNEYYKYSSKKDFDASRFLQSGYSYVGYAFKRNEDKTVSYDQFIIDKDFNIIFSLSSNYGQISKTVLDKISYYELVKTYKGEKGYVQSFTGSANLYDRFGNIIFSNSEREYLTANYNNGMMVCSIVDQKRTTSSRTYYLYGALNMSGSATVPFDYSKLSMFTGFYTIGEKTDSKGNLSYYLVGQNGHEILLYDGATKKSAEGFNFRVNTSGTAVYKTGCYVYYEDGADGKTYFGVKNTNPDNHNNIMLKAEYSQIVLYEPAAYAGTVFAACKKTDEGNYEIYKIA